MFASSFGSLVGFDNINAFDYDYDAMLIHSNRDRDLLRSRLLTSLGYNSNHVQYRIANAASSDNFTCDEMKRWLGSEKHYSAPEKKKVLFDMEKDDKECGKKPVLRLRDVSFGKLGSEKGKGYFKNKDNKEVAVCDEVDEIAVVVLSNFSIKHNFSHFLHSVLRLFCALLDAQFIVWDEKTQKFKQIVEFTLWFDEQLPLTETNLAWYNALGLKNRSLRKLPRGKCVSAKTLIYGNGCVKFLPPEKWFGYPGCRANKILPAFGEFMREKFRAASAKDLLIVDEGTRDESDLGLRVAFAVRDVGHLTGQRRIGNLAAVQSLLESSKRLKSSIENITFEHLDGPSTVRFMSGVHIFISVHGAGMTNMFFMNPGSAVIEILPWPLCNCKAPDYFYGIGGYYHGSATAGDILHYSYCVPEADTKFHTPINVKVHPDYGTDTKCSWRHLHAVESIKLDPSLFLSFLRGVERDLIIQGTVVLKKPVINMNPHANG